MEQTVEVGGVWIAKDQPELEIEVFFVSGDTVVCKLVKDWGGYVKGEIFTYTKNTLFRIYAKEVDKACFDAYQEGYRFGNSDAKKEYEENCKSKIAKARQHHYDMGYNDALAHMASEEAENASEIRKQGHEEGYDVGYDVGYKDGSSFGQTKGYAEGRSNACKWFEETEKELIANKEGYEDGFDDGFSKGYNTAIEEMSDSQALGETTEYIFGADNCCERHKPNKETQEAMQEVLDKASKKHSHYFKDTSMFDEIDTYLLARIWNIEDKNGAYFHAFKKVLDAGKRGNKGKFKDIGEAIDSLKRYLEIERIFEEKGDD